MDVLTLLEPAPAALAGFANRDDLWLKREDLNELGMFKWRAALPVVESFVREGKSVVVTSSTGNHGIATAWSCRRAGIQAIVFVPPHSTPTKLALLEELRAEVRVAGSDLDEAKSEARAWAAAEGLPFFEDGAEPLQYDAYGAIGEEILDQCEAPPGAIVIPVGNGALAGGIGAAVGRRAPDVLCVGVVASQMPVMAVSHDVGEPAEVATGATIADGLAVRVAIPLAVDRLNTTLDRMVRVSERELAEALVACHDAGVEIEPSAAAAVAAVRAHPELAFEGRPVVLVMTGRNVDPAVLDRARTDPSSFAT